MVKANAIRLKLFERHYGRIAVIDFVLPSLITFGIVMTLLNPLLVVLAGNPRMVNMDVSFLPNHSELHSLVCSVIVEENGEIDDKSLRVAKKCGTIEQQRKNIF